MMFSVQDKVVYPGHGVALIARMFDRVIGGTQTTFYELRFLTKDMSILVPEESFSSVGVRRLSSAIEVQEVVLELSIPPKLPSTYEFNASSWNKRNKHYQFELRTGNLLKIARIYRELQHISQQKELSFGERNLLAQTEGLLSQEIALVQCIAGESAIMMLRSFFTNVPPSVKLSAMTT